MIQGISTHTGEAGIEHMLVTGLAVPEGPELAVTVMREDLDPAQQAVYDDGTALVSGNFVTVINNTVAALQISRMTSQAVSEDEGVFDFDAMSEPDKDKLRDLLALFIELS